MHISMPCAVSGWLLALKGLKLDLKRRRGRRRKNESENENENGNVGRKERRPCPALDGECSGVDEPGPCRMLEQWMVLLLPPGPGPHVVSLGPWWCPWDSGVTWHWGWR